MPTFDPIATPAVRVAPHREPAFVFPELSDWLLQTFSALRVGEYQWVLSPTSADATDVHGAGGLTGVTPRYTHPRLYNLYLDPKETHSYLTRKLADNEAFREGLRDHLRTFTTYPPKEVMGLGAG